MSATFDVVVRGQRVLTADGQRAAEVGVRAGRIAAVEPLGADLAGTSVLELAADEVLLPGLVDSHVHVNEPGRTEWEGFSSATRAAAAGGVTTLIDMPLNSVPPTTSVAALEAKRDRASSRCYVDVGFWGGAVPGNTADLRALHEAGVFGFKAFLTGSGVDEFGHLLADELERDMQELADLDTVLLVHAEDDQALADAPAAHGRRYPDFLASRPPEAEYAAIAATIDGARRTGVHAHILHLSAAEAVPMISDARADGVRVTAETCPHYLTLAAEEVPDGATSFKCCPPIRSGANQDRLWQALAAGTVDVVVTDHSPSTVDLKAVDTGDFGAAWGGIASLQLGLAAVWSTARSRNVGLEQVVHWMSGAPAELFGLTRKGRIAPGHDADLVVFAPDESFVVDATRLQHKNPLTPYQDYRLSGVVRHTLLRGEPITDVPRGTLLRRGGP